VKKSSCSQGAYSLAGKSGESQGGTAGRLRPLAGVIKIEFKSCSPTDLGDILELPHHGFL